MRRTRGRILSALAILLGLTAGSGIYLQAGSVLSAPALRPAGPAPAHLGGREVRIPSASGSVLSAWLLEPDDAKAVIVLLHGVRGHRLDMLARAEMLWLEGYALVLPDLQAHGQSSGRAITFGFLESLDATATVEFARESFPGLGVGGVGVSLGGAAFALAGTELRTNALVLESVFPTIQEAVDNRIALRLGPLSKALTPLLLAQMRPRLGVNPSQLRPIEKIALLDCPLLVASGTSDRHTTEAETRNLFAAAREPKTLWLVQGAGHVDLFAFSPDVYRKKILTFFRQYLLSR